MIGEIIGLALVGIGLSGIRIVSHQQKAIVERFGKYSRTLSSGFNWVIPGIEHIKAQISLRIHEIKSVVEVKTSDNQFVSLPVSIMIVPGEDVADAFYKLDKPSEQIRTWVLNSVRSIANNMSLEELFSDKEHIVNEVRKVISTKISGYGYKIEAVLVDQPSVSPEVQHSFNRVVAAKREAEAATQEGLAAKIKAIAVAEAEAESMRIRAKGMSDARAALAQGMSESARVLSTQGISYDKVIETLVELNRLDTLREVGNAGNTILVDLGSSKDKSDALLTLLAKKDH